MMALARPFSLLLGNISEPLKLIVLDEILVRLVVVSS